MNQKFIILPDEFSKTATSVVGSSAKHLAALSDLGIMVPASIVIPQNTLKIIGQANNLQTKIYKLIQDNNFQSSLAKEKTKKQLVHIIRTQRIPNELAKNLLKTYHAYFSDSFLKLMNAEPLFQSDIIIQNIHSDTNFTDALLELWARISAAKFDRLLASTHQIHEVLFPSPILVQKQLEPQVSGTAFTFDTKTGQKNRVTVKSSWGVYTDSHPDSDTYFIDVRTHLTTAKSIQTKETQYRRVIGKLRTDTVLVKQKDAETLTPAQLEQLSKWVSTIKKQYLSQLKINWAIENSRLYIESVSEADVMVEQIAAQPKTSKKVFSIITNSFSFKTFDAKNSDGIALYNSGELLAVTGTHPAHIAKTKQKNHLVTAISRSILKYLEKSQNPLIYRANNYTSKEFTKLSFASLYEVTETNPALGYRGALRHLSQKDAFQLEIDILMQVTKLSQQEIIFLLPFVRSPEELAQLVQVLQNTGLTQHKNISLWLEVSTPENILNISAYPLKMISGIVCNTQNLHACLTGIDPQNSDVSVHYTLNQVLLKQLIRSLVNSISDTLQTTDIHSQPSIFVDITPFNKGLLDQLCDLKIAGFIVNAEVTDTAKKCMIEQERETLI